LPNTLLRGGKKIKLSLNASSSINYAKIEAAVFLPSLPAGGYAQVNFRM
jgi:hypothetical protein